MSDRGAGVHGGAIVMLCIAGASFGRRVVTMGEHDVLTWSLREMGRTELPSLLEAV
jgi:hypothetical protein